MRSKHWMGMAVVAVFAMSSLCVGRAARLGQRLWIYTHRSQGERSGE